MRGKWYDGKNMITQGEKGRMNKFKPFHGYDGQPEEFRRGGVGIPKLH
jgi:hypothetical protein